ncbi:helix-turn-helix domain-containing protein [Paenibacillus silviterrae]|uniref:helix-turn-helix domain-containing protein n=1 Tax=Paenibacillus silviterrae TaxID=3242194 RepID=UPI0025435992|nr:AraC family transcriptional regulator [Paenibacillus chinjuensis]
MVPLQLFIESLIVRFWHVKDYALDSSWRIGARELQHNVLWYVRQGRFSLSVNGTTYSGESGSAYLLPSGSEVAVYAISNEISLISVNFDAEISFLSGRSWSELLRLPVRTEDPAHELAPLFEHMLVHASERQRIGQSLLLQADLLRILSALLDHAAHSPPADTAASIAMDSRIHTIVDYLLGHPEYLPSIGELAEFVLLSESHLRKLFLQHTGMSPLAFLHQLKMEQAKRQLILSNRRISEIAFGLGFEDANYFTRLFGKLTGTTPQQYRRQHRLWTHESKESP